MSRTFQFRVRLIQRQVRQWVPAWVLRRPIISTILLVIMLGMGALGLVIWQHRVYFRAETCNSFAFSPEGDELAIGYADGVMRLIKFKKDGSVSARYLKESISDPGFSTQFTPYIYPTRLWGGWRPAYIMNEEQPSPDGKLMARKASDGNWILQPVFTQTPGTGTGTGAASTEDADAHPSAITMAGGQGGSEVRTGIPGFGVRWCPDGSQLAILQAVTETESEPLRQVNPAPVAAPAPSPSPTPRGTNATNTAPVTSPAPSASPAPPAARSYGAKIPQVRALRVTVWDIASRRVAVSYDLPCIYTESIAWSRDGTMMGTAELTRRDPLIISNKIGYTITWWDVATGRRLAGTCLDMPPSLNSMVSGTRPSKTDPIVLTSEIRDVVWSPDLDRVAIGINITPLALPSHGRYGRFSYIRILSMPPRGGF
ncbi:MAG: hypothetical protein ACAI35_26860 [Candidatus Methylacidiphilales bacterium]